MATGGKTVATVLGDISRDHLQCGICHERYQTPKILNCLHSFCEKCLLTYQKTLQDTSVIPCPVCWEDSKLPSDKVSGLKTNFHLKEIVDNFALKEKLMQTGCLKIPCELCEDQWEAQWRCMDCPFLLCKQCQVCHQRIAVTAHHEVLKLDALRTGVADLQKKRKMKPLCQKHKGEKKRFFCETCNELICIDCTVVEHGAHQFTMIEDAAPRLRQKVKMLVQNFEHQMSPFQNSETEIREMHSELVGFASIAEQEVKDRASAEEKNTEENLRTLLEGISRRSEYHSQALQENGITPTESKFVSVPLPQDENSKLTKDVFSTIDKNLGFLNNKAKELKKADQIVRTLIQQSIITARDDAKDGKAKVADSKKHLLSQIQSISSEKQAFLKVVGTVIERMLQALETANNLVTSASDADFLGLQSVIDSDISSLLKQGPPKIPTGYQKIAFQGCTCSNTELGEVVVGTTWTSKGDIKPYYTKKTTERGWGHYPNYVYRSMLNWPRTRTKYTTVNITSIAAFGKDNVLVGCKEAFVVYNTSGNRSREYNMPSEGSVYHVASLPNESFVGVTANPTELTIYWFERIKTYKATNLQSYNLTNSPKSIATTSYGNKLFIGLNCNCHYLLSCDCFSGSLIHQQPVQIQPDFLASMGEELVLVGARNPASVQGLKIGEDTFVSIDPTTECSPEVEGQNCLGLCSDGSCIYVALSVRSAKNLVHVHQYTRGGSFFGCSVLEAEQPVIGTAVTGDGMLVLAEQHKLRLFVKQQQ